MLDEVKKSNVRNLSYVDNGITRISDAREAARELGQLQAESRGKTEQIAENSKQTGSQNGAANGGVCAEFLFKGKLYRGEDGQSEKDNRGDLRNLWQCTENCGQAS